jgi:hypothetical protein
MRVLAIGALLLLSGCFFGELRGIPCSDDDEQCPSNHFCDLEARECRALDDDFGPPELLVNGIGPPGGPYSFDATTPRAPSTLELQIENVGKSTARDLRFETTQTVCLHLTDEFKNAEIRELSPGQQATFFAHVDPEQTCDTPVIIDWFLNASGRGWRGTLNLNIARNEQP